MGDDKGDLKVAENDSKEEQTGARDGGDPSTSSAIASYNPSTSDALEEEDLEKLKGRLYVLAFYR